MIRTMPARVVETPESRVSFHEIGSGAETLLCLHGGGPGASGLGNFGYTASDLGDRFRLLIPDLPGFGDSRILQDPGDGYTAIVRGLVAVLDEVGVAAPTVIGNSLGGGVALMMAALYPERVRDLVLMGAWLPGLGRRVYSPEPVTLLEDYYSPEPSPEKMRRLLEAMVYDARFEGADELVRARYERSLVPDIRAGYERMLTSPTPTFGDRRIDEVVAGISHRTLLMWGRDDRFCSLDDAFTFMTLLPDSNLMIFGETGHWVMIERRHEFAEHVEAFVRLGALVPGAACS